MSEECNWDLNFGEGNNICNCRKGNFNIKGSIQDCFWAIEDRCKRCEFNKSRIERLTKKVMETKESRKDFIDSFHLFCKEIDKELGIEEGVGEMKIQKGWVYVQERWHYFVSSLPWSLCGTAHFVSSETIVSKPMRGKKCSTCEQKLKVSEK